MKKGNEKVHIINSRSEKSKGIYKSLIKLWKTFAHVI